MLFKHWLVHTYPVIVNEDTGEMWLIPDPEWKGPLEGLRQDGYPEWWSEPEGSHAVSKLHAS
jgi:hypothetical protein